jgi:MFS transporter, DHA2 family, multidrug resistance protein
MEGFLMSEQTITTARAGRREWAGLAVLALPCLLVSVDVFVMLLALPHLSEALGASSSQQLWIMDSYGFLLSGFMITMGTLGDRIGRRKLLLLGATGFGLVSVVGAYADSPGTLIVARALLGVAGATIAPSTLALLGNMFTDAKERGLAIGIWFCCFMGGAVLGPVVGGLLLEHFWWGSVFLLGLPVMLLLLVFGPLLLPASPPSTDRARLDLASVALSLGAILPTVYGVKELARGGSPVAIGIAILIGLGVGTVFVRRQRGLADPLFDLGLFGVRAFRTAAGSMFLGTTLMGAMMLFNVQYLQLVAGLSPLDAGLCMIPVALVSTVSVVVAPLLARRIRPGLLIGGGLLVSVLGLLVLASAGSASTVVIGFAIVNLGAGPLITLSTELILGSVPPARAGSAAAIAQSSGEFGFALGIAFLGSIGTAVYSGQLDGYPDAVRDSLAAATAYAAQLPSSTAEPLLAAARAAFAGGMRVAALISAVLLAALAVIQLRSAAIRETQR